LLLQKCRQLTLAAGVVLNSCQGNRSMTESNSTAPPANRKSPGIATTPARVKAKQKPNKPYDGFALFAHPNGQWAKKIKGRIYYFGGWADPDAAIKKYIDNKDNLHAGLGWKPEATNDDGKPTLVTLVNKFLAFKKGEHENGELSARALLDYERTCKTIIESLGGGRVIETITPDDFAKLRLAFSAKYGLVRLSNEVQRTKTLFAYGAATDLVTKQIKYGEFKKPKRLAVDGQAAARTFRAHEIHELLKVAGVPMRAMILLGLNCGFGNADCGRLPRDSVNLETGWVNYRRQKTNVYRRCKLWPETVEAIKAYLAERPTPKDEKLNGLLFITKYGGPWHKENTPDSPVSKEMAKLMEGMKFETTEEGRQRHLTFYSLRHCFETYGGRDQVAIDAVMGHKRSDMASRYRNQAMLDDQRLIDVAETVRLWLYGEQSK